VLIVKVLHLWMVVSWFAGLFYLPRIFVNLAMVAPDSVAERDRLLLMAGKLYRFMTPIAVLASPGSVAVVRFRLLGRLAARQDGAGGGAAGLSRVLWSPLRDFQAGRNARTVTSGTAGSTKCQCWCCWW
jgi:hypothetical protein